MSSVLPFQLQPRPADVIDAEVEAELARHHQVMRRLWAERAGTPARAGSPGANPPAELRQSKAQAAHELGISEKRLSSLLVRYHLAYPDRPKLAAQPAGFKNARWLVYTDRVRRVIESGEPY